MSETRLQRNNREFVANRFPLIPADKGIPDVELNTDAGLNGSSSTLEFDIETANDPVHAQLDFHFGPS